MTVLLTCAMSETRRVWPSAPTIRGMPAIRSADFRSACTSTNTSLAPARRRPAGILVSALAMALARPNGSMPLLASLNGSMATRISSSASPQVSAISVPEVLARRSRRVSASRERMPSCGEEGCSQLRATMMVEAIGVRTTSSGSMVPLGKRGTVSPKMSRTCDQMLSVSELSTLSYSSISTTDCPALELERSSLISGISRRAVSIGSLIKVSIRWAVAPGRKVLTPA